MSISFFRKCTPQVHEVLLQARIDCAKKTLGPFWSKNLAPLFVEAMHEKDHLSTQVLLNAGLDPTVFSGPLPFQNEEMSFSTPNYEDKEIREQQEALGKLILTAIKAKDLPVVRHLLANAAADKTRPLNRDEIKYKNEMHCAIKEGFVGAVECLLENNATRNDEFLIQAAHAKNLEIMALLVRDGANFEWALLENDRRFRAGLKYLDSEIKECEYRPFHQQLNHFFSTHLYNDQGIPRFELVEILKKAFIRQHTQATRLFFEYDGLNLNDLSILHGLDVTGFDFCGSTYKGKPLTKEMLQNENVRGVDAALFNKEDV